MSTKRRAVLLCEAGLLLLIGVIGFSILRAGKAPMQSDQRQTTRIAWVDRTGSIRDFVDISGRYISPRRSKDATSFYLTRVQSGGRSSWLFDTVSRKLAPVDGGKTTLDFDLPSPDGRMVAFSRYDDRNKIYLRSMPRAAIQIFTEPLLNLVPIDWSADGKWIAVAGRDMKRSSLWLVRRDGGGGSSVLAENFENPDARFSPDGKWLAFTSNRTGEDEIYVFAVTDSSGNLNGGGSSLIRVSTNGGHTPEWSRTSDELYYLNHDNDLVEASGFGSSSRATGSQKLFRMTSLGVPGYEYAFDGYCADQRSGEFVILLRALR